MDSDSWIRISSTSSRRFNSRSGGGEEYCEGGEEESMPVFLCPFCAENYDIVGLCCHIDEEHAVEAKNGVCPVCAKKVGFDLIGHVTLQHGNLLKVQRKRRFRRGGSNMAFSSLRKELRDRNLQSLLSGSSNFVSSYTAQPDPLLSSFVYCPQTIDEASILLPFSSTERSSAEKGTAESLSDRKIGLTALSDKEQEEKARKCEFVHGLLLSTFLDDDL